MRLFAALVFLLFAFQKEAMAAEGVDSDLERRVSQINKPCNLTPASGQTQFIVGYGSLMQSASRERTVPKAGPAFPIEVLGYQRGWFAMGTSPGFDTTYLGALPNEEAHFNAVAFSIPESAMPEMDVRESFYCRILLQSSELRTLHGSKELLPGQYWMYVNGPQSIGRPTAEKPLVQSYVDIFIGGCLSIEAQFELSGFAKACIRSTSDWSPYWVNDRLYPRRPFLFEPKAFAIDGLLKTELPTEFSHIRIE